MKRRMLLMIPGALITTSCGSAAGALQGITLVIHAVEDALAKLEILTGIPAESVHAAARYLTLVIDFVERSTAIITDASLSGAERARRIIDMSHNLVVPVIPDPRVKAIVSAVVAVVNVFLSGFQSNPDSRVTDDDRRTAVLITDESRRDRVFVNYWERTAG